MRDFDTLPPDGGQESSFRGFFDDERLPRSAAPTLREVVEEIDVEGSDTAAESGGTSGRRGSVEDGLNSTSGSTFIIQEVRPAGQGCIIFTGRQRSRYLWRGQQDLEVVVFAANVLDGGLDRNVAVRFVQDMGRRSPVHQVPSRG